MQRAQDPPNDAGLQYPQMAKGSIGMLPGVHIPGGTNRTEDKFGGGALRL